MLIEQIRYHFEPESRADVLDALREMSRLRHQLRVAAGAILIPDETPADEPSIVWQCGYADEDEMSATETALLGSDEYESARHRMAAAAQRVEMELYVTDDASLE